MHIQVSEGDILYMTINKKFKKKNTTRDCLYVDYPIFLQVYEYIMNTQ